MRRGTVMMLVAILLVAMFGFRLYSTLDAAGVFLEVASDIEGDCRPVRGVMGAEDLQIDPDNGLVYVSTMDRWKMLALESPDSVERGGVVVYDLADPGAGFRDLTPLGGADGTPVDFQPHGLSLYADPETGAKTLMVINHPASHVSAVEVFDIVGDGKDVELRHRATIEGDLLTSPNDVVAVGHDTFYASIDHGTSSGLLRGLEDYLRLPLASVVYFDGEEFSTVLKKQTYPNGVAVNAVGDKVYVAETTAHLVSEYAKAEDGGLSLLRSWDLGYGVDNLNFDEEGVLWVAGHPKLLDFVAHAGNPEALSPGIVSRILVEGDGTSEDYLSTDGSEISGLSVAAVLGDVVVLGQVFGDGLLVCE